jgi:hypothetical protein
MVNTAVQPAGMTSWVALIDHLSRLLTSQPVYPCFVLVHPHISTLQTTAERLVDYYGWPMISIGTIVSQALLDVLPQRRPSQIRPVLHQALRHTSTGPILCTDIDLLFEPSLSLNPLRLLRDGSRQTPLIVMWPGQVDDTTLGYAVPEHAHHRTWPRGELCDGCIVPLS